MSSRKLRRTWPQRLTIVAVVGASLACFATAAGLGVGQWVLSNRQIVVLAESPETPGIADSPDPVVIVPGATTTTSVAAVATTMFIAEPDAANFLVTGVDNGDCIDAADPTVGPRTANLSDTIMVWRLNPVTNQLAVLSFPRDLYVKIPGHGRQRINAAFRRDEPQLLTDTISLNFNVHVDHYIQVDFCAFRELVDAVGGVTVPFEFPARDTNVPFQVSAGCVELDSQMALWYVRSRHYQYEDPAGSGNWKSDPTSDFGRIARQQDFIRRVLAKVIGNELYQPDTLAALYNTSKDYVVVDSALTLDRIIEFGQALRSIDPAAITTYRIESKSKNVGGAAVQEPLINGDNMKAILAVFRGEATIAQAPEQVFQTTTVAATTADTSDDESGDGEPGESSDDDSGEPATTVPAFTAPTVTVTENTLGQSPNVNATC